MRAGVNPTKGGKLIDREECHHRIVIPVHIPNEEGYFKDAYKIFEMGLFSILKTTISKVKISVISNKCSDEINARLLELYEKKNINELTELLNKDPGFVSSAALINNKPIH